MDASQIPDVHSPNFPNSGVLKWMPDGPTVLARMDRSTVKTYTSFLAYTKTFSPYVDRLGLPYGKYFWQLPENGSPFSLEERALDILAMNDPYYQYRIVTLPTGFLFERELMFRSSRCRGERGRCNLCLVTTRSLRVSVCNLAYLKRKGVTDVCDSRSG